VEVIDEQVEKEKLEASGAPDNMENQLQLKKITP